MKDWESWKRIDQFYSQLSNEMQNTNVLLNMSADEFKQKLSDILVYADGSKVSDEDIAKIPIDEGLSLIVDFFFIYAKLNFAMQEKLIESQNRVKESIMKLKDLKTPEIPSGENE
jgi:hypothetical protein